MDLHLYVDVKENEDIKTAITRTEGIIEQKFERYGFTIHEIGENEDSENEIKAFLTVDADAETLNEVTEELSVQLY